MEFSNERYLPFMGANYDRLLHRLNISLGDWNL